MATFMERLAFLQKVPTLMKATADDENPCPGYLFQEIGKISHESSGCGQCLLEYLLERLQVESCHVKLKVLKIFVHLCGHGSSHFLTELRRNSTFIQQASVYSGPPDPIHGTALYQKVRNTAQEVARLLFTDAITTNNNVPAFSTAPATMGMGSATSHRSGMQGFGYSPGKQGTATDSLLDKIQKAAEVVASAVLPPTEHQGLRLHENHYRAVQAPSAPIEVAIPACAYNLPACRPKVTQRCPGQVGGGWEETDSGNSSSHNSSQDIAANSRASDGTKSAGTGSQSGASRESSGDPAERVEALQLGDCRQETALINRLTEGSRVFLSREESQHFIKECCILNCEVLVELLSCKLQDLSYTVKMRALCVLACLMTSDLLSLEQMFGATQRRLRQLSEGPPGPVANKATKILRQFEALMGGSLLANRLDAVTNSHKATANNEVSTHDDNILPTLDGTKLSQPDIAPSLCTQQPSNHPSSSATQCCATEELLNSNEEEDTKLPIRTSEGKLSAEELTRDKETTPASELQRHIPLQSRLSLFSGMELVTKGRLRCERQISHPVSNKADDGLTENQSVGYSEDTSSSVCSNIVSNNSQTVSAFSFLNF